MKIAAAAGPSRSETGEQTVTIRLGDGHMIEHTQLTPVAAEQLMRDLHTSLETLRGIEKALPYRDRHHRVWRAFRGH